ncbi:MAG: hypothetical protein JWM58_3058 [Rhizobium sp.]|nr:hypothetical protein [Rhizobium sp.]
MTEITVKHEPVSGAAVIEIRGADVSETRFRLRDPLSEKYLTRRGWTKTASYLPAESATADGVLTLTLDADLARKVAAGTNLSLEQPGGFQEIVTWPAATPAASAIVETPVANAAEANEPTPEALILESFEPSIMHDQLHVDERPAEELKAEPAFGADNDNQRQTWQPVAIAAVLFVVLGMGLSYFLLGSDSTSVKQAQQAAAMQIEKQKWEFDRQLAAARKEASTVSLDKTRASDAEIANLASKSDQLAADRNAAQKALADKNKSIEALQKQLDDANTQIAAVKNAAGDEAKAQIGALDQKIASMTTLLDKANADLAQRDRTLRETQARLTEATDQITADRETAKQEAEAQKASLSEQISGLTAEVEKGKQQLGAQERALKEAQSKLAAASDELAARESAKNQESAQNTSLTEKINLLTAQVKQGQQQLAERDGALRDVQSKLSVANIQIDALKVFAGKTTEAGLEKTAMSEKLKQLTAELDKTSQSLSDREQALTEATAKLRDTETRLALADKRNEELAAGQPEQGQTETQTASDDTPARLQEERDLYANELKTMTANFSALQTEKAGLEKTVADLQAQIKDANITTSQIPSKAVWGATAIDQSGAIYSLQNQTAQKLAQDNVTALCSGKSRARCESLTTYSNACFSVARFRDEGPASDNYAYFVHKDWKTASQTALERCQSMGAACTVRFTACSPDMLSKPVSE